MKLTVDDINNMEKIEIEYILKKQAREINALSIMMQDTTKRSKIINIETVDRLKNIKEELRKLLVEMQEHISWEERND